MSIHIAIFGAGAFGGWTALELVRRGARVTLVDAWGPGNVRASSGGETRIIRATYGSRTIYTRMAARALALWRAHDARWQRGFYRNTGVLWLFRGNTGFSGASLDALKSGGIAIEEIAVPEARRRYPQIDLDGVSTVLLEPDAGYLLARRACEHVVERVIAEGGVYREAAAAWPVDIERERTGRIRLRDGDTIDADAFVFACGPWLGALFPDTIGPLVAPTRQEVYYFGTPPGDARFSESHLPAWIEVGPSDGRGEAAGEGVVYGIPGNAHRGFKFADDTPGEPFDPSDGDRNPTPAGIARARSFIAARFPALATAPLVGAEVCQYESTPDAHFLIDRHPLSANVWIAGGGSGHGFKMGPAVGELVASFVLGAAEPPSTFRLGRFARAQSAALDGKWS